MAVRLSVIMIQSKPPTAAGQRMADDVVGQLIGKPGIDLTLIGPLSSIAETSTDRLTLESLSGDVVALDWQDPEAIVRGLAAVNFQAQRAPHPHDREVPSPPPGRRRVFAFDMNRFRGPHELVDALTQFNARRQVRTFTIGAGTIGTGTVGSATVGSEKGGADSKIGGAVDGKKSPPETAAATSQEADGPTAQGSARSSKAGASRDLGAPRGPDSRADARTSGLDLDDLLDQLDQADP